MSVTGAPGSGEELTREKEILVRVKLCGNCNPYMDAAKVLRFLGRAKKIRLLYGDDENWDVFLSINGCDRACTASCAGSAGLVINGKTFRGTVYRDEKALANAVADVLYRQA